MKSICVIVPDIGGGTLRHAREMAEAWSNEVIVLYIKYVGRVYDVAMIKKCKIVREKVLFIDDKLDVISSLFAKYNVQFVHIHHFIYVTEKLMYFFRTMTIPYMVTLHDYYAICPRINLLSNGIFCDIPSVESCNICLRTTEKFLNGFFPYVVDNIVIWRNYWLDFLKEADSLYCPSNDQRNRILRVFPQLINKLYIVENPEVISCEITHEFNACNYHKSKVIRIGIIGSITKIKGRDIILTCAELAEHQSLPIIFVIFGTLNGMYHQYIPNNVEILGQYKEQDIYQMIVNNPVDYFWFPGNVPETYSYVLTIPIRMGIPVLASDIGAISERIKKHRWGEVYPLTCAINVILSRLMSFDYQKYVSMGDFTVYNDKFPSINSFYKKNILGDGIIEYSELSNISSDAIDVHTCIYGKLKNLSWEEYKMLAKVDKGKIGKIKLIIALDKNEFVSRGINKISRIMKKYLVKKYNI